MLKKISLILASLAHLAFFGGAAPSATNQTTQPNTQINPSLAILQIQPAEAKTAPVYITSDTTAADNQYVKNLVTADINTLLAQGLLKGQKGDKGDPGQPAADAFGSFVPNDNTAVSAPIIYNRDLPEELIFDVKYLGGHMRSFALNFSRPGGQVVAQYYNFVRLGKDGYAKTAQGCASVGTWFADELRKLEIFQIIYDGRGGLPGCTWNIKPGEYPRFNLYDLADRLRSKGWQVPAYPMPPNRTDLVVQRMVARLGVSRDLAGLLLDDVKQAIKFLSTGRAKHSLSQEMAGGYNHS